MDDWLTIRTRVLGARQARTELLAEAAAIKTVGDASLITSRHTDTASRSSFLYRQGLFTLRRGLYATTLSLGAAGAGALTMGIRFDAGMEQSRISLTYFLGSTKAANTELALLYKLAATTPFEFGQVTDAARRFLAFGFTLQQTNDYLTTLGDTAAGLGLGGEDVARLAIILGQIKSSGRLLGQDTLQLAQAGINARGILQEQLHLSPAQMLALGQGTLSIPSEVAIPALMAGLQKRFKGMAALQANTGIGLWSTTKDYGRQFFGVLTGSLFERGKSNLKSLNVVLQEMSKTLMPRSLGGKGGSFTDALMVLDRGVGANGRIVEAWRELRAVGQDVFRIVHGLAPVFGLLWVTLGLGSPPMRLLIGLLGFVSRHTHALIVLTALLSAEWAYNRTIALSLWAAEKVLATGYFLLSRAILAVQAATWLWNAALALNPVVAITIAVIALAAAVWLLIHRWQQFKKTASGAFGGIGGAFLDQIPGVALFRSLAKLPGLAGGGTVLSPGRVIVGEKGPELLSLPSGATVTPLKGGGLESLPAVQAAVRAGVEAALRSASVNMDGRKVGELVFRAKQTVDASA